MATVSFDEKDTPILKTWIVSRLEDISDADSDVLADYVLALIKSDDPEEQARANCIENLEDFLKEHTQRFVDDVFRAVREKTYLHGGAAPPSHAAPPFGGHPGPAPFNAPSGPSNSFHPQDHPMNGDFSGWGGAASGGNQSRKRNWAESEDAHPSFPSAPIGERNFKQMRRGGYNMHGQSGYAQDGNYGNHQQYQQQQQQQQMPQMPSFPGGFPNFDPNNPMAAMMAMQAMGMPPLPDLNQFNQQQSSSQQTQPQAHQQQQLQQPGNSKQRCLDYETMGYCAAGSQCPYDHGDDHIVVGGQSANQPETSSSPFSPATHSDQTSSRGGRGGRGNRGGGRGRGRGGPNNTRGGRAPFSSAGPNSDTRITSVVVEQIPDDKFSDEEIRKFFQEFGSIQEISMQSYKRLAIITFEDHASAKKAYESPKVIFDNRFVKVYWYKPEASEKQNGAHRPSSASGRPSGQQGAAAEDEEMLDPEEFAKKQAEAQRAHEEKLKKLKEAETAKDELDKRIKAQADERKKLMEKLAAKTGVMASPSPAPDAKATAGSPGAVNGPTPDGTSTATEAKTEPQSAKDKATEALRAKLAELEAEAETLGLAPEDSAATAAPYGGRGGRGGRGGFRGGYRGGYDPSFRGGARGGWRGGYYGPPAGGAVARLDNRPKSVRVTALDDGVDFSDDTVGEALRAHLYGVGAFASIQPPAEASWTNDAGEQVPQAKQRIVTFHERYVAELFLSSAHHTGDSMPGVGKVEMAWVPNSAVPAPAASSSSSPPAPAPSALVAAPASAVSGKDNVGVGAQAGVKSAGGANAHGQGMDVDSAAQGAQDDWDVADDEENNRWMMT